MSSCCGSPDNSNTEKTKSARKFACPVNKTEYVSVDIKTMLQHIKSPWLQSLNEDAYYFCDDPDCNVVYFSNTGSTINKSELRTQVGIKEESPEALICYCFGVTKALAHNDNELKAYVTQQTKEKNCACDIRNPSGRCCLKDFPKPIQ